MTIKMINNTKHKLLYKFLKTFVAPLILKIFLKKINNFENLNHNKAFVIASNHASYLDPPIIATIYIVYFNKKVYFLGKKELFTNSLSRIIQETAGTIPVNSKGKYALKIAKKYLQNRRIICIFPEGERSLTGKLQRAKTGVARLALSAKVPVLPIAIKGTFKLMPRGTIIPKLKKKVTINVGRLLYFDKFYGKRINKKILRVTTNQIMRKISDLMN